MAFYVYRNEDGKADGDRRDVEHLGLLVDGDLEDHKQQQEGHHRLVHERVARAVPAIAHSTVRLALRPRLEWHADTS